MRRPLLALAVMFAAAPAAAQQYWLPNGPGGTTYNNPQGSLLGTMNEHMLQRHMQQRQWEQQRQQGDGSYGGGAGRASAVTTDPSFRLNNSGNRVIREVYVSSARESSWGADRLGADTLPPGRAMVVRLPDGQCVNDVRVVFMDGEAQERRQVNTCALTDMAFR
jgi:hypothetical protein